MHQNIKLQYMAFNADVKYLYKNPGPDSAFIKNHSRPPSLTPINQHIWLLNLSTTTQNVLGDSRLSGPVVYRNKERRRNAYAVFVVVNIHCVCKGLLVEPLFRKAAATRTGCLLDAFLTNPLKSHTIYQRRNMYSGTPPNVYLKNYIIIMRSPLCVYPHMNNNASKLRISTMLAKIKIMLHKHTV